MARHRAAADLEELCPLCRKPPDLSRSRDGYHDHTGIAGYHDMGSLSVLQSSDAVEHFHPAGMLALKPASLAANVMPSGEDGCL